MDSSREPQPDAELRFRIDDDDLLERNDLLESLDDLVEETVTRLIAPRSRLQRQDRYDEKNDNRKKTNSRLTHTPSISGYLSEAEVLEGTLRLGVSVGDFSLP